GTSLFGGRGSAWSALLGIIVIQSISNGLTLLNLPSSLRYIITEQVGANSSMHGRLTKLDAQLKEQMNRIIERRSDGLTFHY
ncbi:hypothetical protein ACSLO7_31045, partial [Klebsiella pneumoniae]